VARRRRGVLSCTQRSGGAGAGPNCMRLRRALRLPCAPAQEDDTLRRQVAKLGARNWSLIAKAIPGRSGKSCRLRWVVWGHNRSN
jgi:myb proto-oncogene protein